MKRLLSILFYSLAIISVARAQQAKTTNNIRLYGTSTYGGSSLIDSTQFFWGGNRYLSHYNNPLDLLSNYALATQLLIPHEPKMTGNDNLYGRIPADKIDYYSYTWVPYPDPERDGRVINTFNSNNEIIKSEFRSNYPNKYVDISYNSLGKIVLMNEYVDTSSENPAQNGNYVLANTSYLLYNSSGKHIKDSIVRQLPVNPASDYIQEYLQDGQGRDTDIITRTANYPSVTQTIMQRIHYDYTATGQVTQRLVYDYSVANTFPVRMDSFTYTLSFSFPTYHAYKIFPGPDTTYRAHFVLNANGDVDKLYFLVETDTFFRYNYYYNSNHNADSIIVNQKWGNAWTTEAIRHYFNYNTPSYIPEVQVSDIAIELFPNPVNSLLNIKLPQNSKGNIHIYDLQGRVLKICGIVKDEQSIDVSRLPVGIYLVQYSGNDGIVGTARFVKE